MPGDSRVRPRNTGAHGIRTNQRGNGARRPAAGHQLSHPVRPDLTYYRRRVRILSRTPRGRAVKAVRVVRHGAPTDALEVQDIPVPDVGPGEVRIAVSAASLNFGDIARCRGTLASVQGQVPFTLGMDVCGGVDAAGAGAEEWPRARGGALTNQTVRRGAP